MNLKTKLNKKPSQCKIWSSCLYAIIVCIAFGRLSNVKLNTNF